MLLVRRTEERGRPGVVALGLWGPCGAVGAIDVLTFVGHDSIDKIS
jgi:hypothetical protein